MPNSTPLPSGALSRRSVITVLLLATALSLFLGWSLGAREADRAWLLGAGKADHDVIDAYSHWAFEHWRDTFHGMYWMGVPILEYPVDMWEMQEVIYKTKPDVLIETGTYKGGSSLFFASLFDLIGKGRVITVDILEQPNRPTHPRITYLVGSSTSPGVLRQIEGMIKPGEHVMVFLDSDHHTRHVTKELNLYSPLVTLGDYLVVADTNPYLQLADGTPPGPGVAVASFLENDADFVQDMSHQKWGYSDFPGGWLKRVR